MAFFPSSRRTRTSEQPPLRNYDLDALSDRELEALLFEEEPPEEQSTRGSSVFSWKNAGIVAVLLVAIGALSEGLPLELEGELLFPLLIVGLLLYALKSGSFSWSCSTSSKGRAASSSRRQLARSTTDKKLMGVCGGIADYCDMDTTLVRFGFILGLLATGGPPMGLAYLGLAYLMPKGPAAARSLTQEERLRIIRES